MEGKPHQLLISKGRGSGNNYCPQSSGGVAWFTLTSCVPMWLRVRELCAKSSFVHLFSQQTLVVYSFSFSSLSPLPHSTPTHLLFTREDRRQQQ